MATSGPSQPPLAERADIHKACKSFETLLSVFNDYCEAAGAVVALQKKMAKTLRETAGMKVTGEIAANALNASATIFEVLSEVETKFAKLADKEYDGVSSDVKKWFKKLAKEEKAHDERIAIANAKIKQAGQIYERKSKKSPREANEEHARYINLISVMGPEISQDKYNHSLLVTQRHTNTTLNLAASVSRVADAEWLRSCENVRRFAPSIGKLSELRAFCEGGWTGPIPQDLKDVDTDAIPPSPVDQDPPTPRKSDFDDDKTELTTLNNISSATDDQIDFPKPFPSPGISPAHLQYQSRQNQSAPPPSSFDPPRKFTDDDNTGSVRSLSQFPAPPTHFPLPPPLAKRPSASVSFPSSPLTRLHHQSLESENVVDNNVSAPSSPLREKTEIASQSKQQSQSDDDSVATTAAAADIAPEEKEEQDLTNKGSSKESHPVTRVASNGSVVAAMRNRYTTNSGSTSPPPKDIPRLPLSVNNLATRYQSQSPESPSSPPPASRSRPLSPSGSRPLPSIDTLRQGEAHRDQTARQGETYRDQTSSSSANRINISESFSLEDERRRQQQRLNQLAELEIKGKERELRLREQEIELRSQELEREKALLISRNEATFARDPSGLGSEAVSRSPLRPRERHLSFQQPGISPPSHRADSYSNLGAGRPLSQYSSPSATHLVPPPPSSSAYERSEDEFGSDSYRRDGSQTSGTSTSNHAPYCGCENCSAAKYKLSSSSPISSPSKSDKEKMKGWMRRLSMPIVGDSKKNAGYGKGIMSLDSKKNTSTTALKSGGVTEDGRFEAGRRSYDAGGIGHRSTTNLNARR